MEITPIAILFFAATGSLYGTVFLFLMKVEFTANRMQRRSSGMPHGDLLFVDSESAAVASCGSTRHIDRPGLDLPDDEHEPKT